MAYSLRMKILIFGATGMVGQGVLRESLLAPDVSEVVAVVRSPIDGESSSKLTQIVHSDFYDYSSIASQLSGFDACFFCLGTTSAGKQ